MERLELMEMIERLTTERDALRMALEVIAVGDSKDPVTDAGDELVALGFWNAEALAAMRASIGDTPAPQSTDGAAVRDGLPETAHNSVNPAAGVAVMDGKMFRPADAHAPLVSGDSEDGGGR